jgi:hypothetical protein
MRPFIARCHLGLGNQYRRASDHEQAREHLATATTLFGKMDIALWRKQAEAGMRAPAWSSGRSS